MQNPWVYIAVSDCSCFIVMLIDFSVCIWFSIPIHKCCWIIYTLEFSYMLSREYRVAKIDIHGCHSLVKIAFAPICACKNNWQIWRNNASYLGSRDVIDQL